MDKLLRLLAAEILDFDCPECVKMGKCIDAIECRLYAAGRKDAADLVLAQLAAQSTPLGEIKVHENNCQYYWTGSFPLNRLCTCQGYKSTPSVAE